MVVFHFSFLSYDIIILRHACGVEFGDDFIVTGGVNKSDNLNTVALYSQSGFVRWLAPMNQARRAHACTKFVTDTGDTVRKHSEIYNN